MNWSWLLKTVDGVPVLMYHKVWPGINDDLTITPERLREHWVYLAKEGYSTLSMRDYLEVVTGKKPMPPKAMLLTFDDGYVNNLTYVYPLLKEFGWQATFFIIGGMLDGSYEDAGAGADKKMTGEELRTMDREVVQLGMHGYNHEHLGKISVEEMKVVLERMVGIFEWSGLAYEMVFAYPYGGRPKDAGTLEKLKQMMREMGIFAAFRIGNKVSEVPGKDVYELKRIDIKGTDTIKELSIKVKKGKLKPF